MKAKSPDMTLHANDSLYVPNCAPKATAKAGAQTALALALDLKIFSCVAQLTVNERSSCTSGSINL
jgi:hypothetical protein